MREEMERSILVERRQSRDEQWQDRDEQRQDRDEQRQDRDEQRQDRDEQRQDRDEQRQDRDEQRQDRDEQRQSTNGGRLSQEYGKDAITRSRDKKTLKGEEKTENNNVIGDKGEVEVGDEVEEEDDEEEELAPILDGLDQSNVTSPSVSPVSDRPSPVPDCQSPLPDRRSPSCTSGNDENGSNTKCNRNRPSSSKNCDNNYGESNSKNLQLSSSESCLLHARILAQLQVAAAMGRKRGLTLNDIVAQVVGREEEAVIQKKRVKMDDMTGIEDGDGDWMGDNGEEEISLWQNAGFVYAKAVIIKSVKLLRNEGLVALGDGGNYTFVGGKPLLLGGRRAAAAAEEQLSLGGVENEQIEHSLDGEKLSLGGGEEELPFGGGGGGGTETKSAKRSSTPRKRLT